MGFQSPAEDFDMEQACRGCPEYCVKLSMAALLQNGSNGRSGVGRLLRFVTVPLAYLPDR